MNETTLGDPAAIRRLEREFQEWRREADRVQGAMVRYLSGGEHIPGKLDELRLCWEAVGERLLCRNIALANHYESALPLPDFESL